MVVTNGMDKVIVHTVVDDEPIRISIDPNTTAEDVCIQVSRDLKIGPVARYLFALRLHDKNVFLGPNVLLSQLKSNVLIFRMRFKVPQPERLEEIDIGAYNYFFHQARRDFVDGEVPDISYDKKDQKKEAVGLAITDMYLFKLEKGVDISTVVQDYKKFFPKKVQNYHSIFLKKPIREYLSKIEENNLDYLYIKRRWIEQFREMAPSYLTEEFTVLPGDDSHRTLSVRVDPYDEKHPGVQVKPDGKKDWTHLCGIEDLCYIAVKFDNTIEISRKNGIPSHMKFPLISIMISFVSLLDGYYRLMINWTFNLCKEVRTPSLQALQSMNCHGPVGKEFSYSKLKEKRDNCVGCYLLRESEIEYDTFYLDVCSQISTKEKTKSKPKSYAIKADYHKNEEGVKSCVFTLTHDNSTYSSIQELIKSHRVEGSDIWLKECLPPSEFETSGLLLCRKDYTEPEKAFEQVIAPFVIDAKSILLNYQVGQAANMLSIRHGIWKQGKSKDVNVVVKSLERQHYENHPQGFIRECDRWTSMARSWALLHSSCIVRLLGIVMNIPPSLVMEDIALGPLDNYLKENRQVVKAIDLVEAFYNSRRTHSYSVALPKRFKEQSLDTCSISDSEISMLSGATVETLLDSGRGGPVISNQAFVNNVSLSSGSNLFGNWILGDSQEQLISNYDMMTPNISAMLSNMTFSTAATSLESMSSVFELGPDVNVVLQGRIGQGFYGEVYKGTLERLDSDAELVAVKKLRTDALSTTMADFEREINIMKTLEHPNVVQIKGVVHEPEVSLVMEFVQHGSLKSYLKIHHDKLLPDKHLLKFALDVARGMEYLGQKNIVHRDLAARNILVVDEFNVKISDFGLAQVMGQNDYYIIRSNRELPIPWYAPESLRDGKFSPRSDVWSYGVTLFEMFSLGEEPRLAACTNEQDHHELLRVLDRGDRLPCPTNCPQQIYVELMTPCWRSESRDRPSFSDICDVIKSIMTIF
ncbi:Tyrosine-protein kinase hopscotch [Frankliniella fusca]|uniref:non-specific protein-tyrosine kinase n=1 Tax=Frankliniella fusca TaxID=407009 RepID=A0AAE1L8V9_9NEOP|nr:Tyrosine-protein kinase hopscotch [Frankliniella fusca]